VLTSLRLLKVLHVSRPLEGGVRAPDDPDELDYESLRKVSMRTQGREPERCA
jgi:hypothetical protein